MELKSAIERRRSIREFDGTEVSDEDLDAIMQAGLLAPTGRNEQNISFVAVKDPRILTEIRDRCLKGRDAFYSAPAVIFCIETTHSNLTDLNCGAAMQNMSLEATELGLASVWIHSARNQLNTPDSFAFLRSSIGLQDGVNVLECLCVGHSTKTPLPKPIKASARIVK